MNTRGTMTRLEEIKARVQAATPGPWRDKHKAGLTWVVNGTERAAVCYCPEENAPFIAAAKQDIPFLLAEVERLTAERDDLERRAEAAEADLVLAMENSNSFMSCEPCVHRGYDPDDGLCCKLKSCKPKWRGPEPGGEVKK